MKRKKFSHQFHNNHKIKKRFVKHEPRILNDYLRL